MDRQLNGQQKNDWRTNNDQQNIHIKLMIQEHEHVWNISVKHISSYRCKKRSLKYYKIFNRITDIKNL